MARVREPPNDGLFPETPAVLVTVHHIRLLDLCLKHPQGILQTEAGKKLHLNKKTISVVKRDLIRLGWLRDIRDINEKTIFIKPCCLKEIRMFLSRWKFLQRTVLVRPHRMLARGLIKKGSDGLTNAIKSLSRKYLVIPSFMKNNVEYSVFLPEGTAVFHEHGEVIQFFVEGFILPVGRDDIYLLEEYIKLAMRSRLKNMIDVVQDHFFPCKIQLMGLVTVKDLHAGILLKKDAARAVGIASQLKKYGLFPDDSVPGMDEFECHGRVDAVLNRIVGALTDYFSTKNE
jgi:hypothetical protein